MPIPDNVVTGIFSVLSMAIGGLIGYSTSVSANSRKEFNQAAIEFHATFFDVIMSLDQRYYIEGDNESNTCVIIEKTFRDQMKAMLRFRQFIPKRNREAFDLAWREYCHYDIEDGPNSPFIAQYFEKKWEGKPTRELALQRIEKLISFAELNLAPPFKPESNG